MRMPIAIATAAAIKRMNQPTLVLITEGNQPRHQWKKQQPDAGKHRQKAVHRRQQDRLAWMGQPPVQQSDPTCHAENGHRDREREYRPQIEGQVVCGNAPQRARKHERRFPRVGQSVMAKGQSERDAEENSYEESGYGYQPPKDHVQDSEGCARRQPQQSCEKVRAKLQIGENLEPEAGQHLAAAGGFGQLEWGWLVVGKDKRVGNGSAWYRDEDACQQPGKGANRRHAQGAVAHADPPGRSSPRMSSSSCWNRAANSSSGGSPGDDGRTPRLLRCRKASITTQATTASTRPTGPARHMARRKVPTTAPHAGSARRGSDVWYCSLSVRDIATLLRQVGRV